MSILDARELAADAELSADVCVVGAGAAGIVLTAELTEAGLDVCLIESGGFTPEADTQQLYDLENTGYPIRENFMARARYYGGSCNLWAGRSMRLQPADLEGRDWPISFDELASYYAAAGSVLRLPPLEAFDPTRHHAVMSEPERRLFADGPLAPTVSLWAKRPMRFGAAYRSRFQRSPRVRLVLHANVTQIGLNAGGTAVDAVEAATLTGRRLRVRARYYVLACGGLENARLLLTSRDVHPAGIGNGHDLVGRYFMDHPRAVFGRVQLAPTTRLPLLSGRLFRHGAVQLGIGLSADARKREGLLNHYATLEAEVSGYTEQTYQSFIRTMKVLLRRGYAGRRVDVGRTPLGHIQGMIYLLTPKEIVPHFVFRWYTRLRAAMGKDVGGRRVVVYFCEQPPNRESRVTLSPERDPLGLPKLALHWHLPPDVTAGVLRLQDILRQRLPEAGIGTLEPGTGEPTFTDASHHLGTARMSATPATGVVDAECRVHGVGNLFVAGGAVFPSGGHANPTPTIVALALRLARRLRTLASNEGIR